MSTENITGSLTVNYCPIDIVDSLGFWIVFILIAGFIFLGLIYKQNWLGFLGSLALTVFSWYIVGCQASIGYIVGLMGMLMMLYFVLRG